MRKSGVSSVPVRRIRRRSLCLLVAQALALPASAAANNDNAAVSAAREISGRPGFVVPQPPQMREAVVTGVSEAKFSKGTAIVVGATCSLDEAIMNANTDSQVAADCAAGGQNPDVIDIFSSNITLEGELYISDDLQILGNGVIIDAGGANRHFQVNARSLSLSNMTLINGSATNENGIRPGGSIWSFNGANVTIDDVTLSENQAEFGGAISISQGDQLTITDSRVSRNSASTYSGAIDVYQGAATITGTHISDNSAGVDGGGIYAFGNAAQVTIQRSSLSGNRGGASGAATITNGSMVITNSTISGNSGTMRTVTAVDGQLEINHATLVDNTAAMAQVGHANLQGSNDPSTVTLRNSIVADARRGAVNCAPGGTGQINRFQGVNLDDDASCGDDSGSGSLTTVRDPGLMEPIMFGNTMVAPPEQGSPAIDRADYGLCQTYAGADGQLALGRRPLDGDNDGAIGCDIGAVEISGPIFVTSLGEPGPDADGCTLRDAITVANTNTGTGGCSYYFGTGIDNIVFREGLAGTVSLSMGGIRITEGIFLNGPGRNLITIDAGRASQIFRTDETSVIQGLHLTGGDSGSGGGAIYAVAGTLTVRDATITSNTARYGGAIAAGNAHLQRVVLEGNTGTFGGAVHVRGRMTIDQSIVTGNSAGAGGGLYGTSLSNIRVLRSTLSGNTASSGAAIHADNAPRLEIAHSTIAGNSAAAGSKGIPLPPPSPFQIRSYGSALSIHASILATQGASDGNCSADLAIIDTTNMAANDATCGAPAITYSLASPLAANRSPLSTHAVSAGSSVVDAIPAEQCPPTDQRGASRVGACDLGAYELIPATITVSSVSDAVADDGECTLREAAVNANDNRQNFISQGECEPGLGLDSIEFSMLPNPSTISLAGGYLRFDDPEGVSITGPGASALTVDATGQPYGLFFGAGPDVLTDLTVTGSSASEAGAGVVAKNLEMRRIHVHGVSAGQTTGGAIVMSGATLAESTVDNNTTHGVHVFQFDDRPADGGSSGVADAIVNSTIGNNTAQDILADGPLSTLTVDSTTTNGSGITANQTVVLTNSIIAGATATCSTNYDGVLTVIGPVLSESASCMPSLQVPAGLGPLQDNGGPTPTHLPLAGSPAIDTGDCRQTIDQRGLGRPTTLCDIGAVELQSQYPTVPNASVMLSRPNANVGTTVATVLAIDPESNALVFAITAGNTGGAFAIDGTTGIITVADPGALAGQTQFALEVTVTDPDPNEPAVLTASGTVTVDIIDANTSPLELTLLSSDDFIDVYPGLDGLIGTGDDVNSAAATNGGSTSNTLGAFSSNAFNFGGDMGEPELPTGFNGITFVAGSVTVDQLAFTNGGPIITDLDITMGTEPFPDHGPYTAVTTAVNSGTFDPATGAFTLDVDLEFLINGEMSVEPGLMISGVAVFANSGTFGATGNEYVDTVISPRASAAQASSLAFFDGMGTLPNLGLPIRFVVVGLNGSSPTGEVIFGDGYESN